MGQSKRPASYKERQPSDTKDDHLKPESTHRIWEKRSVQNPNRAGGSTRVVKYHQMEAWHEKEQYNPIPLEEVQEGNGESLGPKTHERKVMGVPSFAERKGGLHGIEHEGIVLWASLERYCQKSLRG